MHDSNHAINRTSSALAALLTPCHGRARRIRHRSSLFTVHDNQIHEVFNNNITFTGSKDPAILQFDEEGIQHRIPHKTEQPLIPCQYADDLPNGPIRDYGITAMDLIGPIEMISNYSNSKYTHTSRNSYNKHHISVYHANNLSMVINQMMRSYCISNFVMFQIQENRNK